MQKRIDIDGIEFSFYPENKLLDVSTYVGRQNEYMENSLDLKDARILKEFLEEFIKTQEAKVCG